MSLWLMNRLLRAKKLAVKIGRKKERAHKKLLN